MPRLWTETIDEHRRAVRDAAIDAAAALVTEHGLAGISMSRIAEHTGIGRATLYKYFPDVDAILLAWHQRQVTHHLQRLTAARDRAASRPTATPLTVLRTVLDTYATLRHRYNHTADNAPDTDLTILVHRGRHITQARQQLHDLLTDLLTAGNRDGSIRADIPPDELATYCLHALDAAADLPSRAAVHRLIITVLTGLHP